MKSAPASPGRISPLKASAAIREQTKHISRRRFEQNLQNRPGCHAMKSLLEYRAVRSIEAGRFAQNFRAKKKYPRKEPALI